jgi:hypothetical protein
LVKIPELAEQLLSGRSALSGVWKSKHISKWMSEDAQPDAAYRAASAPTGKSLGLEPASWAQKLRGRLRVQLHVVALADRPDAQPYGFQGSEYLHLALRRGADLAIDTLAAYRGETEPASAQRDPIHAIHALPIGSRTGRFGSIKQQSAGPICRIELRDSHRMRIRRKFFQLISILSPSRSECFMTARTNRVGEIRRDFPS